MAAGTMFSLYLVLILSASVCSESVSPPCLSCRVCFHTKLRCCGLSEGGLASRSGAGFASICRSLLLSRAGPAEGAADRARLRPSWEGYWSRTGLTGPQPPRSHVAPDPLASALNPNRFEPERRGRTW